MTLFDQFYQANLAILYPAAFLLIAGVAEFGVIIGKLFRKRTKSTELGTFTGAALGLLALLLGFSFSLALARYDSRHSWVLEESNAISSTANFALMLPKEAQKPILNLLGEYVVIRRDLGIPYNPAKFDDDIRRSLAIQLTLWQRAILLSEDDRSLAVHRFITSLNEMNNIHERRLTALRYHVPSAVTFILGGVAMLVIGFTGYHAGMTDARRQGSILIISLMVAAVVMLIVDLDRPTRGFVQVPSTALDDAVQGMPVPSR